MKAFFVLMLLLNVAVFVLLTMDAREDPAPYPPRPAEGTLRLADEAAPLDSEPELRPEPAETGVTDTDDGIRCYTVTGLDQDRAQTLADTVRTGGDVATVRASEARDFIGYWVFVPPHDTMAAAQETMAELAEQGISDYGYVGGNDEHAVSLGVFSTEERAHDREAEIRALGIETETGERYRTVTEYTVTAGVDARDDLPPGDWQAADCQDLDD